MKNWIFIFCLAVIGIGYVSISELNPVELTGITMIGFSAFACTVRPARACSDCVTDERNKVVHVAFVKRGTSIGTSASVGDILSAELSGLAYVIRNVSGSYDGGKATYGKGLGKAIKRLLAKTHTLTFIDFDYVENAQYWADMEGQAQNYDLYFFTDTQVWVQTNAYLSIEAVGKITDDNTTFIEADITATWSYASNPINYNADVDSLSSCQQLFDGTALSFYNISGSTATIIAGTGSIPDEIDMVHASSVLNARLNAGAAIASVSVIDGTLPAGLTLSYTGNFLTLSGTATTAGTATVIVKGANATGVAGQKSVKFVIS